MTSKVNIGLDACRLPVSSLRDLMGFTHIVSLEIIQERKLFKGRNYYFLKQLAYVELAAAAVVAHVQSS